MNSIRLEQHARRTDEPAVSRRVVHTENLTIARLDIQKDAVVPEHSHVNEQVATVERGALQFHIGGRDQVVRAGEILAIPPNVPHSVVALEDTTWSTFSRRAAKTGFAATTPTCGSRHTGHLKNG